MQSNGDGTVSCQFCPHKINDLSKKTKVEVEHYIKNYEVHCIRCDKGILEDNRSFSQRISEAVKLAKTKHSGLKYLAFSLLFIFTTILSSCYYRRTFTGKLQHNGIHSENNNKDTIEIKRLPFPNND
jgi:predicted nucleic acid-binding Zn ribbon protein